MFDAGVIYFIVTRIYEMYGLITSVVENKDHTRVREIIITGIVIFIALLCLVIAQVYVMRFVLKNISSSLRNDLFSKVWCFV